MNYEQKYNDALDLARTYHDGYIIQGHVGEAEILEDIFTELKESEDERTKREIRNFIWEYPDKLPERTKWLAWFEKQGQEPKKVSIWKHWKNGIAGNGRGEQVYLIRTGNTYNLSSCLGFECDYIELSELDNLMIEKSDKQPTDKVEPKFKVGDWLQYRNAKPFFVEEITKQGYVNGDSCLPFNWENEIHLWTINDAKDGDVLALISGQCIFLFDGNDKEYCHYSKLTNSFSPDLNYIGFIQHQFVPANREQRNLLFSKMREAGYEWDSDKKELKKMEVASKESDDDMIRKVLLNDFKNNCSEYYCEGVNRDMIIAWLEKQGKQKQTWKPTEAQLIVIKDLIEDKNISKVNKVILQGMFDEFKQYFGL